MVIDRTVLEEAIRRAADPVVLTQRVADEAMTLVEAVDGVLVGFVRDPSWLDFDYGAGQLESQIGKRIPLGASLAGLAFTTGATLHSDDAGNDPRVAPDFSEEAGLRSLVCVPLWRRAEAAGVLCVASARPRAFNDRDVATLTSLAEFISVVITVAVDLAGGTDAFLSRVRGDALGTSSDEDDDGVAEERFVANVLNPGAMRTPETQRRVDYFLKGRGISHVFQPVFDIASGECFAVEALARFSGRPKRPPDDWFASAAHAGRRRRIGGHLPEGSPEFSVPGSRGHSPVRERRSRGDDLRRAAPSPRTLRTGTHRDGADRGGQGRRLPAALERSQPTAPYGRTTGYRRHRCRLRKLRPHTETGPRFHQA